MSTESLSAMAPTFPAYNARMDEIKPASSRTKNVCKSVGLAVGVGGWLTIVSLEPLAISRPWIFWPVGIAAFAISTVGFLAILWADRRWPESRPPPSNT